MLIIDIVLHFDNTPAVGKGLCEGGAPWPSAGLCYQLGQPHQIVGGSREDKGPCDAITAAEASLLLPADRLDPAECLLDALADALAESITDVPGRSPVNRRAAATDVLCNMRCHVH